MRTVAILPLFLLATSGVTGAAHAQTVNGKWVAPLPQHVMQPMIRRDFGRLLTVVDAELRLCQAQASEPTCLRLKIARVRALAGLGRLAEAAELARQAVAEAERHLGASSEIGADALERLGTALIERGQDAEGDAALERAQSLYEQLLGVADPFTVGFVLKRSHGLLQRYQPERAEQLLRRSITLVTRANPADQYDLGALTVALGKAFAAQNRYGEALAEYYRGIAVMTAARSADDEEVILAILAVATVEMEIGRIDNAVGLLKGVAARIDGNAELKPIVHRVLFEVMAFFAALERWDILEQVLAQAKKTRDPAPSIAERAAWRMFEIEMLKGRGDLGKAERLIREPLNKPPSGTVGDWRNRASAKADLAMLLIRQRRWAEGDALLRSLTAEEDGVLREQGPGALARVEGLRAYFALGTEDFRRARHHFSRARSSTLDRVARLRPGEDARGPLRESLGIFLGQVQTSWLLSQAQQPGAGRRIAEQMFAPEGWAYRK